MQARPEQLRTRHVVGGDGQGCVVLQQADDVQVGQARFDHHDVCALVLISSGLPERLARVGGVLLVGALVARDDPALTCAAWHAVCACLASSRRALVAALLHRAHRQPHWQDVRQAAPASMWPLPMQGSLWGAQPGNIARGTRHRRLQTTLQGEHVTAAAACRLRWQPTPQRPQPWVAPGSGRRQRALACCGRAHWRRAQRRARP